MKPLFYSHWQAARPMQNMLHCKLAAPVRPLMVARSFGCETAMQVQFSGTMQPNYTNRSNSQLISHHEITRTARRKTEKKRAKDKSHFPQPGMRLLRKPTPKKQQQTGPGPNSNTWWWQAKQLGNGLMDAAMLLSKLEQAKLYKQENCTSEPIS